MGYRDVNGIKITKKADSDSFYATWNKYTATDKAKVIKKQGWTTKSEKTKKTEKIQKKFGDALDGFEVQWYYKIPRDTKYYPDGSSETVGKNTTTTISNLYSPSDERAHTVYVRIRPKSKTYVTNKKGSTAKWFDEEWSNYVSYSIVGILSAPTIEDFAITKNVLGAKISFASSELVDRIHIQVLKDSTTYVTDLDKDYDYDRTTGLNFKIIAESISDVGSYQIHAKVQTLSTNKKTKKVFVSGESEYSDWYGPANTIPKTPELVSCEAIDSDKLKITWNAVENISKYTVEYVSDSEEYFSEGLASTVSITDGSTSTIITGLTTGITYYFRVKSIAGESTESEPSNVMTGMLAVAPDPPTTWSLSTVTSITDDVSTTDHEYLYWTHNSKDGSAQRSSELEITIASKIYYLFVDNSQNTDQYGNIQDKTMEIDMWPQTVYTTEGSNTTAAGTIYDLFKAGGGDNIKWNVRTKGIADAYSDWSTERIIKAYAKPTLALSLLNQNGESFTDNNITSFPFYIKGVTTPSNQTPISFYVSITAGETYTYENEYGDDATVVDGTTMFSTYVDKSSLNLEISASDINLMKGIHYYINSIVYMDSGLKAEASLGTVFEIAQSAYIPDAEIWYNDEYRYTKIRPYCEYYIGNETITDMPNVYHGEVMTGTDADGVVFADSGIASAVLGDLYFNSSTYSSYICVLAGDASTAKWAYRTVFDFDDSNVWYFGTKITLDNYSSVVSKSGVTAAVLNDYYLNTDTGDVFKCFKAGAPSVALWDYAWNVFWQVTPNIELKVYRKNSNGTFTMIVEGIDNAYQSSDSPVYVKDRHPSFGGCTYRIIAKSKTNGGVGYFDVVQPCPESSIIIQWNEKWTVNNEDPNVDEYDGMLLELPANINLSDSSSPEVSLVEYIGRSRPVSYYGTQKGESSKLTCVFPAEDTDTLDLLRRLMVYTGDVYIREPSGLGYWANVTVSYELNHREVTIPVSLDVKPVEGGA